MKTITAKYRNHATKLELHSINSNCLTSGQKAKASEFGATHYFATKDVMRLPNYVATALKENGWEFTQLGYTSYKSSKWGVKKTF